MSPDGALHLLITRSRVYYAWLSVLARYRAHAFWGKRWHGPCIAVTAGGFVMQRFLILLFGLVSYTIFFITFLYLIAFVGNLQQTALVQWLPWLKEAVPYSVSFGRETGPLAVAIAIDIGLIALFGLQHSIMARSGFKAWLKHILPEPAERSVYVLLASAVLVVLFWQWRPIPDVIWSAQSTAGQVIGWSLFGLGFATVLLTTFLINHFNLFGLQQVWMQFTRKLAAPSRFVTPLFYRYTRHPLYLGFLLAFWGTPYMTAGHLLFAVGMTVYILLAIPLEEKDLIRIHGDDYLGYRKKVPMIVPIPGKRFDAR